jgi:hypothetical protein
MAARVVVGLGRSDGADRVHGVRGAALAEYSDATLTRRSWRGTIRLMDSWDDLLWISRIWYGLVGCLALAASIGMYLTGIASGCRVEFSRIHTRSTDLDGCVQRLDAPFMVVAGITGLLLLCAAMWVKNSTVTERSIAGVGIVVGGLAGFVPAAYAIDFATFYGASDGVALPFLAVLLSLTLVGICAAIVMAIGWCRAK